MAAASKITPQLIAQIMGLSALHSNRQIEAILSEQGIKLSNVSIAKIVKEHRRDRSGQTKEAVQVQIVKTVMTDLDILEDMRNQLNDYRKDPNLRVSEKLMCMDRLNKVIDTRLKYSGAGEPDEKDEYDNMTDEELRAYVGG